MVNIGKENYMDKKNHMFFGLKKKKVISDSFETGDYLLVY